MESVAAVDVIARRGPDTADECTRARALYVRVVPVLSRLDTALA